MTENLFNLENKISVVTGGSGYLGKSICEGLLEAGSDVYLLGKSKKNLELATSYLKKNNFKKIKALKTDISSFKTIQKTICDIEKEAGRIDVLVNNAAYSNDGNFDSKIEKTWNYGIDGTINNVFRVTKLVLPIMQKQKKGSIINLSSIYGVVSPDPSIYGKTGFDNPPEYGAGKAAIIQFTKYLAVHYAKFGIRSNSISPGPFPNKQVQKHKKFISELKKKNPMKRIGEPSELKGPIVFLASNASSFITGQNIHVDGGWTIW